MAGVEGKWGQLYLNSKKKCEKKTPNFLYSGLYLSSLISHYNLPRNEMPISLSPKGSPKDTIVPPEMNLFLSK